MKTLKLNPELVIKVVNGYVKTDIRKNTNTRKKEYVEPRQLGMYFLHKYTELNLTQVGRLFNKHHATVLHAIKTVPDWIQFDKGLRDIFVAIRSSLLKNASTLSEYSPGQRFESIADDLSNTKRLNALLVHRAINLKAVIDSMPKDIKYKYFKDDKYIYPTKSKDNGVGVVYKS